MLGRQGCPGSSPPPATHCGRQSTRSAESRLSSRLHWGTGPCQRQTRAGPWRFAHRPAPTTGRLPTGSPPISFETHARSPARSSAWRAVAPGQLDLLLYLAIDPQPPRRWSPILGTMSAVSISEELPEFTCHGTLPARRDRHRQRASPCSPVPARSPRRHLLGRRRALSAPKGPRWRRARRRRLQHQRIAPARPAAVHGGP